MVLKYADLSFYANARLVHGSGDGHAANISALVSVKAWSKGTASTILADCTCAQDVPFSYGTEGVHHDVKHAEQTGFSNQIKLPGHPSFQVDVVVMGLRGIRPDGSLVKPGTELHLCCYKGKSEDDDAPNEDDVAGPAPPTQAPAAAEEATDTGGPRRSTRARKKAKH